MQPYSVFLKGWYGQIPNYIVDLTDWTTNTTTSVMVTPLKFGPTIYDVS